MKVSVIVPAWGETPYLAETLAALDRQTFRDFEVIRCEPPEGERNAGAARNVGLARATGEWLWFLDADDVPLPTLLEEGVRAGERTASDLVIFRADELDARSGSCTPMPYLERLVPFADGKSHDMGELGSRRFTTFGLAPWNKLVRRELVERCGLRFQSVSRSNDLAFSVELLSVVRRFVALDRSLIRYRVNNAGSLQHSNAATPLAFLRALEDAKRRLHGEHDAALAALWDETVLYNLHSVRTLAAYRELCAALGRNPGLKGMGCMSFKAIRAWETLRERGLAFCLRRLSAQLFSRPQ